MIGAAHTILYVADQEASCAFYSTVLDQEPALHVPGMTEFHLAHGCVLGLMPVAGIRRLLGGRLPDPAAAAGVPRVELYLYVDDPARYHKRALECGAGELSPMERRSWGDWAAYSLDSDGHVLAFASRTLRSPDEAEGAALTP
jgi:catechol 2,3-dioxygenase-like lactoylglutathione lyase family enzyme